MSQLRDTDLTMSADEQDSAFGTALLWQVSQSVASDQPPLLWLMSSQDAQVHHNGNHQARNLIHLLAAIRRSGTVVVHLGQSKTTFGGESRALGGLVRLCLTVEAVLLPATMGLEVEPKLLGLTRTAGIAVGVGGALSASRPLQNLSAVRQLLLNVQEFSRRAKGPLCLLVPSHPIGAITAVLRLAVIAAGDVPLNALLIQIVVHRKLVQGTVCRECLGSAQTLDVRLQGGRQQLVLFGVAGRPHHRRDHLSGAIDDKAHQIATEPGIVGRTAHTGILVTARVGHTFDHLLGNPFQPVAQPLPLSRQERQTAEIALYNSSSLA